MNKKINYKTISESMNDILENWNKEFPNFALSERLIEERFIKHEDVIKGYSMYLDDEFVSTLVLKKSLLRDTYQGYISYIYVTKKYRNQGYGTMMINDAKETFKKLNLEKILLGTDYGCAFSGLFVDNNEFAHDFFLKQGFESYHNTYNMIVDHNVDWVKNEKLKYEFLTEERRKEFDEFTKTFSTRWNLENLGVENRDICVIILDDKIVGFARICTKDSANYSNGINLYPRYENEGLKLGALGPLGVDAAYRKFGLGKQVVQFGIDSLFKRGCNKVLVDWTGLIEFYKKCGFTDICDTYVFYKYDIK